MGVIVGARIAAGADGVNRDLLAPGAPEWSWHVTEFVQFAEGAAEILDGSPAAVENDVEGWIANTGGLIGFAYYTVVQEVPEASGPTLLGVGSGVLFLRRRFRRRRRRPSARIAARAS